MKESASKELNVVRLESEFYSSDVVKTFGLPVSFQEALLNEDDLAERVNEALRHSIARSATSEL